MSNFTATLQSTIYSFSYSNQRVIKIPLVIAFVPIFALLGFLSATYGLKLLFLILMVLLGILILKRPIIGLCLAVFAEFTLINFGVLGTSPRGLILIFTLFVSIPLLLRKGSKIDRRLTKAVVLTLIFISFILIASSVNGDDSSNIKRIAMGIFQGIAGLVLFSQLIDNKERLLILLKVILIATLLSASLGILQVTYGKPFYDIHKVRVKAKLKGMDPGKALQFRHKRGRALGLSLNDLWLARDLSTVAVPLVILLLFKNLKLRRKYLLWTSIIIILGGLLATFTRTGILGFIVGTLIVLFAAKKMRINKSAVLLISLMMIAIFLFFVKSHSGSAKRVLQFDRESLAGVAVLQRIPLYEAEVRAALEHPVLGIGAGNFPDYSFKYYYNEELWSGGLPLYLLQSSHNVFLRVWVSYGIGPLLILLLLYKYFFSNLWYVYRNSRDLLLQNISLGLIGSLIALAGGSFCHNYGVEGGFIFWMLGGLSLALHRITKEANRSGESLAKM